MSDVRDFGAAGDGERDDSDAIAHALADGDGAVFFPPGRYRLDRTVTAALEEAGPVSFAAAPGTATLLMHGPGPALYLKGTHAGTAHPGGVKPGVWEKERMPTVHGLAIEGRHPEADGIRLDGVFQPTLIGVHVRACRTAVRLTGRCRNVLIDGCHFYHNAARGIHFDRVNCHQINITSSHVSYNRLAGIAVVGGEVRNLQITGCDIEYNNGKTHGGIDPRPGEEPAADVLIDARGGSIREGTLSGCTVQATHSPGGANVRFLGGKTRNAGMWAIAGNLIGSQEVNVHLEGARGVTLTGNYLYSGHRRNLLAGGCRNLVASGNTFGHNPDYGDRGIVAGVELNDCENVALAGSVIEDYAAGETTVGDASKFPPAPTVALTNCRRAALSGVQVIDPATDGIRLTDCADVTLTGCSVLDGRDPVRMTAAVRWTGGGRGSIVGGLFDRGTEAAVIAPDGVTAAG